jgi:hypothetical protein
MRRGHLCCSRAACKSPPRIPSPRPPPVNFPTPTYYSITLDLVYQGLCSSIATSQLTSVLAGAFAAELQGATATPSVSCAPITGTGDLPNGCLQLQAPATVTQVTGQLGAIAASRAASDATPATGGVVKLKAASTRVSITLLLAFPPQSSTDSAATAAAAAGVASSSPVLADALPPPARRARDTARPSTAARPPPAHLRKPPPARRGTQLSAGPLAKSSSGGPPARSAQRVSRVPPASLTSRLRPPKARRADT